MQTCLDHYIYYDNYAERLFVGVPICEQETHMQNIFMCEAKYFAPIEMLHNTLEV